MKNIFDKIKDKENSFDLLPKLIKIDDYVKGSKYIKDDKKLTYGVNVRISKNNSNEVLPFSFCNDKTFIPSNVANGVTPGFLVPDFIRLFNIKDIVFRVKFRRYSKNDIIITQIIEKDINQNPYSTSIIPNLSIDKIKIDFFDKNRNTFLHENIKGLNLPSGNVYVWIKGEDPDISEEGNGQYLTNILAIANDWDIIDRIRKEKLTEILEFVMLLKSRLVDDFDIKQKKESIKSAISAIMSRNMSHNLGSHYLYYTKADLESLAETQKEIAPQIRGTAKVLGYVQARMDYLATIISNDKYPYGAVNFKSQIFDELTVDDFSRRHFPSKVENRITNFLLTNLVLSENFSRPDVGKSCSSLPEGIDPISLVVKFSNDRKIYKTFTGTGRSVIDDDVLDEIDAGKEVITKESEQEVKNILSTLNIALPGSIMSSHALFNVIENFIRNSAKYMRDDTNKKEGLVFTIAIRPSSNGQTLESSRYIDIILYDNKNNANTTVKIEENGETKDVTLFESLIKKLEKIEVVDIYNQISKDNKGIKEMLFSAIWMKSFSFGDKKTFADIVADINNEKSIDKIEMIEKYGLSFVRVADNNGSIDVYRKNKVYNKKCHLGVLIKLPLFKTFQCLNVSSDGDDEINSMLNIMGDVVIVNENLKDEYKRAFTRSLTYKEIGSQTKPKENDFKTFRKAVTKRFRDIDEYSLCFVDKGNQKRPYIKEIEYDNTPDDHKIYFLRHINNSRKDMEQYKRYSYADTISGGDFTVTLLDLFREGLSQDGTYKSEKDKIFALKIKESALTRITIIDERLYKSSCGEGDWLQLKNIRVMDYDEGKDIAKIKKLADIFKGNTFHDNMDKTHFLTIHLGLIEKILKNSVWLNKEISQRLENREKDTTGNLLASERVTIFMEMLTEQFFKDDNKENIYISIHSGRGNFSAELEGPLAKYPFISLSALENVFNNSKYLLSQLFYNTVYLGKGFSNHKLS